MTLKQKLSQIFREFTFPVCIAGFLLTTIIVCLSALFFLQKPTAEKIKISANDLASDLISSTATVPIGAKLAPRLKFTSYDLQTTLPSSPTELTIYQLENNLSEEKRSQIAQKIDLTQKKSITDSTKIAFINQEDINSLGYLIINQDGSFEFKSFGIHKPTSTEATPTEIAKAFLQNLGLWEEDFKVTTTYQREGLSDLTFVEIHRVFSDLSILNPLGLVGIPPETQLVSVQAGSTITRLPEDLTIINSSDSKNGTARPSDFNTITVVVSNDGRVTQATSNLRLLKTSYATSELGLKLKSPQQALEELKAQQAIFGITLPIGQGTPNLDEIYPNNEAQAEKATITDFILAYLEKSPNNKQHFLQPVYVFRGTASLTTGPTVQWSQIVPAVEGATPLGTLDRIYQEFAHQKKLIPVAQAAEQGIYLPGLGYAYLCQSTPFPTHIYCFKPTTVAGEEAAIEEVRKVFWVKVGEQYTINVARALLKDSVLLDEASQASSPEKLYLMFNKLNYVPAEPPAKGECYQRKDEEGNQIYTNPGDVAPLLRNQWWAFHFETTYHNICIPERFIIDPEAVPDWVGLPAGVDTIPLQVAQTLLQIFAPEVTPTQTPSPAPSFTPTPTPTSLTPTLTPTPEVSVPTATPTTIPVPTPTPTPTIIPTPTLTPTPEIFEPLTTETALDNLQNWANQLDIFPSGTRRGFFDVLFVSSEERRGRRYISGESPTIFIYNTNNDKVTIKLPTSKLTYFEPLLKDRLYYEYDPNKVNFSEPKEGCVVEKEKAADFINDLAVKIGLNTQETQSLMADIAKILGHIPAETPYIKVSLANQTEMNKQLPLSISPLPTSITRIYFLSTPLKEKTQLVQPPLPFIHRSKDFYIVEVGANLLRKGE